MPNEKAGRIVWHDLFTSDRDKAMDLFRHVALWDFQIEHATDYAWGGGEKDFVLALLQGEAGAGFADVPKGMTDGWINYVEVPDVDATIQRTADLGGAVIRHPFDVPGVGRNALLSDPGGALIGISISQHSFPIPKRQFGLDIYLSGPDSFPEGFYTELFNWEKANPIGNAALQPILVRPCGEPVAYSVTDTGLAQQPARWIPSIKVADLEQAFRTAQSFGAKRLESLDPPPDKKRRDIIRNSDGTYCCLVEARRTPDATNDASR